MTIEGTRRLVEAHRVATEIAEITVGLRVRVDILIPGGEISKALVAVEDLALDAQRQARDALLTALKKAVVR